MQRDFQAARARVFRAWADPVARSRWAIPKQEWESVEQTHDFRVGGNEVSRLGPRGDPYLRAETHYLDIVPDARIIMAGTMFARPSAYLLFDGYRRTSGSRQDNAHDLYRASSVSGRTR
jgi:uncharacterized protein YndB with AHSA1/START domain